MKKQKTIDFLIRSTWFSVAKMYNEKASEYGSTMVMGFTLLSIDPKKGTKSTSLGPKMGLEPTSLTRTLKNLEKEGLIERMQNPDDGRSVIIKLTDYGLQMRDISKNTVLEFHNQIQETLTKNEYNTLMKSLLKIYNLTTKINTQLQDEKTN